MARAKKASKPKPARKSKQETSQKLTPRQEAFALAYIETGNASEAYRRSYNASRTKDEVVHVKACELLKHGKIAVRIAELQEVHRKRHEVTIDRLVEELKRVAFADAGDYFDWGPDGVTVRSKSELTPEQRVVVSEVSQTVTEKGGTIRVKLHDKLSAIEKLGKHLGMFIDKHEVSGKGGGPIETHVTGTTPRELADAVADILKTASAANAEAPPSAQAEEAEPATTPAIGTEPDPLDEYDPYEELNPPPR